MRIYSGCRGIPHTVMDEIVYILMSIKSFSEIIGFNNLIESRYQGHKYVLYKEIVEELLERNEPFSRPHRKIIFIATELHSYIPATYQLLRIKRILNKGKRYRKLPQKMIDKFLSLLGNTETDDRLLAIYEHAISRNPPSITKFT